MGAVIAIGSIFVPGPEDAVMVLVVAKLGFKFVGRGKAIRILNRAGEELTDREAKLLRNAYDEAAKSLAKNAELTAGGTRKIGNLADLRDVDAAKAIIDRGGNAGNVREALGDSLRGKTVGQIANLAAMGDQAAEKAMKIIKQAKKRERITNMSICQEFASRFFKPFGELCCSGEHLMDVEGQFFLHDGLQSLTAVKLKFENISIMLIAQEDDSIEIELNGCFVNASGYEIQRLDRSAPWNTAISRPLLWAWMLINQQGYFDGLQFEFAESVEAAVSRIQLLVIGSEFKYQ